MLITGANVGLGLEAARHITRLGAARVILGVRNVTAGKEAKENIEKSTGRPGVCEVWEIDLASNASVLAFGERISKLPKLDVAILNAAVATVEFSTAEGYERTVTVNAINTLLLGLLLLPTLKATRQKNPSRTPRLTFVVSEVHAWVNFTEWKEDEPMKVVSDQTKAKMGEAASSAACAGTSRAGAWIRGDHQHAQPWSLSLTAGTRGWFCIHTDENGIGTIDGGWISNASGRRYRWT